MSETPSPFIELPAGSRELYVNLANEELKSVKTWTMQFKLNLPTSSADIRYFENVPKLRGEPNWANWRIKFLDALNA
ncbi:hypothetical protein MYU51_014299 [Penicillium brevicompactum]|uniref:uncharacterized protein n=1 Tax=Penicillium brevicompactum TaxID=5074 RepID=UPI002541A2AF|nr:uncharacterized protein N7506_007070 [Penicillium brevicompactum]KAJ5333287.1 hypothetical protein N7506_007070 [Penicillium brevicompactum]